jgi:hypothetical protein
VAPRFPLGTYSANPNYILLDRRHPGWSSSPELIDDHLNKLNQNENFRLIVNQDDVFLYRALTTPQGTK